MLKNSFSKSFLSDPIVVICVLSLILNVCGMWWGLPSKGGWAMDEIPPYKVWDGIDVRFSQGWHDKYPPFHYYLLSLTYAPVYVLSKLKLLDFYDLKVYGFMYFVNRFVSVLMGVGSVYLVYQCGREISSKSSALFAALSFALLPTTLYYSKIVNPDVPYVFWFCLSLWFYIKILKTHRLRDYLGFAIAATVSVCTKDQAYGLYVLTTLFLLFDLYRHQKQSRSYYSPISLILDRRIYLPMVTGLGLFVVFQNLLFNWSGFLKHLNYLTGTGSYNSGDLLSRPQHNIIEHFRLLDRTLSDLTFSLGIPILILVALGLSIAILKFQKIPKYKIHLFLLVPVASYYITFLSVIIYSRDRFLLPICAVLSLFAGEACYRLLQLPKKRKLIKTIICLIFTYSFFYGSSVNTLMIQDSRYAAEHWMNESFPLNTSVMGIGTTRFLPRSEVLKFGEMPILKDVEQVLNEQPEYIVTTSLFNENLFLHETPKKHLFVRLNQEQLDYKKVFQYQSQPLWNLLHIEPFVAIADLRYATGNFNKINPEVTIFRRSPPRASP